MKCADVEMQVFFDFFLRFGIEWFYIDAQPRKVDGERGAPIAAKLGLRFPVHASKTTRTAKELVERIERQKGAQARFDLVTRQSCSKDGFGRLLLIDDLKETNLDDLLRWWSGPVAVIETSPMNFQAFLVAPHSLSAKQRQDAQSKLAKAFHGDPAATGCSQLHRLPGSVNHKKRAISFGNPFITRLICVRDSDGDYDSHEQIYELFADTEILSASSYGDAIYWEGEYSQVAEKIETSNDQGVEQEKQVTEKAATVKNVGSRTLNNSESAFAFAIRQIKKGARNERIISGLIDGYLSHHKIDDWPQRTLHNAYYALGFRTERYKAADAKSRVIITRGK